jgi:hypothetical protein
LRAAPDHCHARHQVPSSSLAVASGYVRMIPRLDFISNMGWNLICSNGVIFHMII